MIGNHAKQAGSNRRVQVNMIVNGTLTVEPRMTLLDALGFDIRAFGTLQGVCLLLAQASRDDLR
jgi:hypothetical protein